MRSTVGTPIRLDSATADNLVDEDLKEKPFFPGLYVARAPFDSHHSLTIADMGSGPICAMVWEGRDAVKTGRSKFSAPAHFDIL